MSKPKRQIKVTVIRTVILEAVSELHDEITVMLPSFDDPRWTTKDIKFRNHS